MKRHAQRIASALIVIVGMAAMLAAQSIQSRGVGQAQAAAGARTAGAPAAKPAPAPAAAAPQAQGTAQKPSPAAPPTTKATDPKAGERRDPFRSTRKEPTPGDQGPQFTCPPGVRGIIVGQAELNGVARAASGIIAVVTITNTGRTYFLREGNALCNGRVQKITADSIIFEENVIDPTGKPSKREVIKKIPADAK